MAHVPIPDTVKVCLRYVQNGQNTCNVFHVKCPGDPDEAIMDQIANDFIAWWNANMKVLTHPSTSLVAVEVTDVSADDEEGIIVTDGLPLAGTSLGDAMPNNVTACTKLVSGLTGRSRRGRSYFAGMSRDLTNADRQTLTTTAVGDITAAFQDLISTLVGEGLQLVVASTISGGAPRVEGITTPIINAVVNQTLDSQRRRLPERGS